MVQCSVGEFCRQNPEGPQARGSRFAEGDRLGSSDNGRLKAALYGLGDTILVPTSSSGLAKPWSPCTVPCIHLLLPHDPSSVYLYFNGFGPIYRKF